MSEPDWQTVAAVLIQTLQTEGVCADAINPPD